MVQRHATCVKSVRGDAETPPTTRAWPGLLHGSMASTLATRTSCVWGGLSDSAPVWLELSRSLSLKALVVLVGV